MKPQGHSRSRGFTLVELMMAMAIFALVLSAIYATWLAIIRGSEAGLKATAEVQRERMTMHTIEEALSAAHLFQLDWTNYAFIAENGSDSRLSFVARLPKSFPRGGRFGDFDFRRVEFAVEGGSDSQRKLVLRQCPILMEMDQDEKEHPLVLAKHVKDLELAFWDTRANDWTDTWTQSNQMPKMVRVTLRLENPGHNYGTTKDEFTRVVALPSVAVAVNWQRGAPGGPGPGNPNMPGNPNIPLPGDRPMPLPGGSGRLPGIRQ
jgi:general secretion pathway protein J